MQMENLSLGFCGESIHFNINLWETIHGDLKPATNSIDIIA